MAVVTIGFMGSLASIRDVQSALMRLGYDVGPAGADNILGPRTTAAVRKFQQDVFPAAGPVDGKPGPLTRNALEQRAAALATPPAPPVRLSQAIGPAGAMSITATSARAVAAQLAAEQRPPSLSDLLRTPGGVDFGAELVEGQSPPPGPVADFFRSGPVGLEERPMSPIKIAAAVGVAAIVVWGLYRWRKAAA